MKLYDEIIRNIENMMMNRHVVSYSPEKAWKKASENEIIFKSDEAYELGEGNHPGLSQIFYTSDEELVPEDEVLVLGKDLSELKEDADYARIVITRVDDELLGNGNVLYKNLMKLDYKRYHVSPEGFMMRISTIAQREAVRVSKKAVKEKISFKEVGKTFIDAYHEEPFCRAVKIIFITDPDFDYKALSELMTKSANITKALDHLMNQIRMDCNACSLKPVCDEVDAMVKEDFKKEE